jgi:hypothetical protein
MNPLRRKIHLASGIWSWAASGNYVSIRDPFLTMTWKVSILDILNDGQAGLITWDTLERAHHKGFGGDYSVTPAKVRGYIERHLLRPVD